MTTSPPDPVSGDHPLTSLTHGDRTLAAQLKRGLTFAAGNISDKKLAARLREIAEGHRSPRTLLDDPAFHRLADQGMRTVDEHRAEESDEEREERSERAKQDAEEMMRRGDYQVPTVDPSAFSPRRPGTGS